jgi:hypothetical protein
LQDRALNTGDFFDFQFKNAPKKTLPGYPDMMKIPRNLAQVAINMATRATSMKTTVQLMSLQDINLNVYQGALPSFTLAASAALIVSG